MTDKERELALYCLKASSDYHSEVCEECINYPNCDHTIQDDVTETIIKTLEQESVLDKIKAEIQGLRSYAWRCSDGVIDDVEKIIDKYKAEQELEKL